MIRWLVTIGLWGFPPAAGTEVGGVVGPWLVHLLTVRGVRAFAVRGRSTIIEFGHIENTDPTLDTE